MDATDVVNWVIARRIQQLKIESIQQKETLLTYFFGREIEIIVMFISS